MRHRLAFTGNRHGMSMQQVHRFEDYVIEHSGLFSHGDCIGCDADAHDIVVAIAPISWSIDIYPPTNHRNRAWKKPHNQGVLHKEGDYLVRDHWMVDASDRLFACPIRAEYLHSGTWATVRYARKLQRPILICMPDGTITRENWL